MRERHSAALVPRFAPCRPSSIRSMNQIMKIHVVFVLLLLSLPGKVCGNSIATDNMEKIPREIRAFANDLYAEVRADERLIELFLKEGRPYDYLTEELQVIDKKESIQNPIKENPDGSVSMMFLLHGCNGVFTDKNNTVYYWRLSSPRILQITSQKYESTFLVIDEARLDLMTP